MIRGVVRRSERGYRRSIPSISKQRAGSRSILGRDGLVARRACNLHSFDGVSRRRNTLISGIVSEAEDTNGSIMSSR